MFKLIFQFIFILLCFKFIYFFPIIIGTGYLKEETKRNLIDFLKILFLVRKRSNPGSMVQRSELTVLFTVMGDRHNVIFNSSNDLILLYICIYGGTV